MSNAKLIDLRTERIKTWKLILLGNFLCLVMCCAILGFNLFIENPNWFISILGITAGMAGVGISLRNLKRVRKQQ